MVCMNVRIQRIDQLKLQIRYSFQITKILLSNRINDDCLFRVLIPQ